MNNLESFNTGSQEPSSSRHGLAERYRRVRRETVEICKPLEIEDQVVQPIGDVSPPKWHLGHTTWFFEEMILARFCENFRRFHDGYGVLFNSYYKAAGRHWIQGDRGQLSRPTVAEIMDYRTCIDEKLSRFLEHSPDNLEVDFLLEVGIHHEQQHQELLYLDLKYILGVNPLPATYRKRLPIQAPAAAEKWESFDEGIYEIGHEGVDFAYDNECPRHKVYLQSFGISEKTVTNADFLAFIDDKAYKQPKLWLSQGWDWINAGGIEAPLYWYKNGDAWFEYTLHGPRELDPRAPLTHISYFEADAFAAWSGARLPTEQELEIYLLERGFDAPRDADVLHPYRADAATGQVWFWTGSHYSPYPGFQPFPDMLGEYNGKFMCNQFVLKGGCVATPDGHYRHTYRNFYQPHQRWMFSGIRLARDL